ncbi:MFS transporter [Pseudomonas sp. S9]|uniref:MFS transporter n=1 Tax=Pseudomonas sp. S9 TaxID=686578 RepID=UPI00025570AA|nr:MFS transporter [Pseudomonas sp. S9]
MNTRHREWLPLELAIGLGIIGALGPSAVGMYLSSLTEIASDYDASFATVQLSLTFSLLAMGAGQLLFGPFVDAYGRRWPLLVGLIIFTLCSLGCACAPNLLTLLSFCFVQGLGSALTLVVLMSTVRDASQGVAPIMAPRWVVLLIRTSAGGQ